MARSKVFRCVIVESYLLIALAGVESFGMNAAGRRKRDAQRSSILESVLIRAAVIVDTREHQMGPTARASRRFSRLGGARRDC